MFISKFRGRKGITLIALVITIIVLLILAGVTIAMVVGDNGILSRSNEAKEETKIAKIQEEIDLLCAQYRMDYETNNYRTSDASSDKKIQAMNEILVAYNESDVIVDTGDESSYTSDGSDENITAGTPGAYVANQLSTAKERNETKYKITFEGRKITVEDLDEDLSTWGVMEDSGRIIWNGKYVAGSGANSSGNSSSSSGESSGSENSGGSSSESGNNSTNEPRDTAIESALATRLASSIESDYIIEVSYSPSGTYTWDNTLATSSDTGTTELSSASGTYAITNWRVLDLDQTTGIVRLVPTAPVGSLKLEGAQGYNNAVKLLDDACNGLYKDDDKGITAQSIKEEDFVIAGGDAWTTARGNYSGSYGAYGNQKSSPYINRYYPAIYALEQNAVIDGDTKTGLTQSQQNDTIGKTAGYKQATTNIQPYQTYYSTTNYDTTSGLLGAKYSKLLLPSTSSTRYWVASRCVSLGSNVCNFGVRLVSKGYFDGYGMIYSDSSTNGSSRALFPVVSLSSGHLTANATGNGYTVE